MPDRHFELPAHPDLEYYRKQAKHLQRAYATGDAAAWDQLTAAAFTVVQEDGVMMTRAERLTQFKAQKPSGFAPRTREIVTRLGDVYVARYLRGSVWILDVWTREGGRWKVAAVQVTTAKK